ISLVHDRGYELAVHIQIHLRATDAHLDLISQGPGTNGAARGPINDRGFFATSMQDNFIFRIWAVVDYERVVFEVVVLFLTVHGETVSESAGLHRCSAGRLAP